MMVLHQLWHRVWDLFFFFFLLCFSGIIPFFTFLNPSLYCWIPTLYDYNVNFILSTPPFPSPNTLKIRLSRWCTWLCVPPFPRAGRELMVLLSNHSCNRSGRCGAYIHRRSGLLLILTSVSQWDRFVEPSALCMQGCDFVFFFFFLFYLYFYFISFHFILAFFWILFFLIVLQYFFLRIIIYVLLFVLSRLQTSLLYVYC